MNDLKTNDLHAIELEARRLRAQAFADMVHGFGRVVMRMVAALRPGSRARTA